MRRTLQKATKTLNTSVLTLYLWERVEVPDENDVNLGVVETDIDLDEEDGEGDVNYVTYPIYKRSNAKKGYQWKHTCLFRGNNCLEL